MARFNGAGDITPDIEDWREVLEREQARFNGAGDITPDIVAHLDAKLAAPWVLQWGR